MTEYTLFPIKKSDVDWPLYLMVSCFLKYEENIEAIPCNNLFQAFQSDKDNEDDTKFYYYFVFPQEDLTVSYEEEMLAHEYLIIKRYFPIEHVNGEPFISPDDECVRPEDLWFEYIPAEYYYWSGSDSNMKIQHAVSQIVDDKPCFPFNGDDFVGALNDVLVFLQDRNMTETPWFERLQMVKRMFDGNANELHILHNAGLFDHASLWQWMKDKGIPQVDIDKIKNRYVSELKKMTMFVLNEIDFNYGTVIDEHDREKRYGLYSPFSDDDIVRIEKERNRRREMEIQRHNTPNVHGRQHEITSDIPLNTPRQESIRHEVKNYQPNPNPQKKSNDISQRQSIPIINPAQPVKQEPVKKIDIEEKIKEETSTRFRIKVILIIAAVALVGCVVASLMDLDYHKTGALYFALGMVFFFVSLRLSVTAKGQSHQHPMSFNIRLFAVLAALILCCVVAGPYVMRELTPGLKTELIFICGFLLADASVGVSVIKRRSSPDECGARPYTWLLLISVLVAIGSLLALLIAATK
ncbi:MAG: hypothetical protein J6X58_00395 [Bacteroidales bacterium]|nr:hypothetical protein [Bacteroidales bacterium]